MVKPANIAAFSQVALYWMALRAKRDTTQRYANALSAIERAPPEDRDWWRRALKEATLKGSSG